MARERNRVNEVPVKDLCNRKLAPGLVFVSTAKLHRCHNYLELERGKISAPGYCHADRDPFMIYSLLITQTHIQNYVGAAQHRLDPSP